MAVKISVFCVNRWVSLVYLSRRELPGSSGCFWVCQDSCKIALNCGCTSCTVFAGSLFLTCLPGFGIILIFWEKSPVRSDRFDLHFTGYLIFCLLPIYFSENSLFHFLGLFFYWVILSFFPFFFFLSYLYRSSIHILHTNLLLCDAAFFFNLNLAFTYHELVRPSAILILFE